MRAHLFTILVISATILIPAAAHALPPSTDASQDADGHGILEWLPRHIDGSTTVEAGELPVFLAQHPNVVIVDSRTETEYVQGHIPGSLSIEAKSLDPAWLETIAKAKDQPIVFYGAGRDHLDASIAVNLALQAGYKSVYYYPDGIWDWRRRHGQVIARHPAG